MEFSSQCFRELLIINSGIIKLQHLLQKGRCYASISIMLIIMKHQLFLTTFNRHSNYMTSIIFWLFSNEIANIGCTAYRMNFFIIELISKVFIVSAIVYNCVKDEIICINDMFGSFPFLTIGKGFFLRSRLWLQM